MQTSTGNYKQNANDVISRLKSALNIDSDAALCRLMNMAPANLANWKSRGLLNEKPIIALCYEQQIDLNYIFRGIKSEGLSVLSDKKEDYGGGKKEENPTIKILVEHIAYLQDRLKKSEDLINELNLKLGEARDRIAHLTAQKRTG